MSGIAERQPMFCSEADFHHEFAMAIRASAPNLKIGLEYPLGDGHRGAIDRFAAG